MAFRIYDELCRHFSGDDVFIDIDTIPFGEDFREYIAMALHQAVVLVVVIGPKWLGAKRRGRYRIQEESDPVRVEAETAFRLGIRVIPVLVERAEMVKPGDLPETLHKLPYINAAPIESGRGFRTDLDRLIRALEDVLANPHRPGSTELGVTASQSPPDESVAPVAARAGADAQAAKRLTIELVMGRVVRDGVPVQLSDKEFELLALLGFSRTPLTRDRIGEALWDHLDPEEWPNNLKVTLSRLRAKLGVRDAVVLGGGEYRLSRSIEVDLPRAESLVRQSSSGELDDAKRGELQRILAALAGVPGRYERFAWAHALTARLTDLVVTAGAVLAADAFARKEYDDALGYAAEIRQVDPFSEIACEMTIRTLLAQGDLDAARRELRRYTAVLANELGMPPSKRLLDLFRPEP
jgi:DNA-binding SARP family transcriptional activator